MPSATNSTRSRTDALAAERAGQRGSPRRHLACGELDLEVGDLTGVVGDDGDSSPRQAVQDVPLAHDARDAVDLFEARRSHVAHHRAVVRRAAAPAARRCTTVPDAPIASVTRARQTRERRRRAVRRIEHPRLAEQVAELAEEACARAAEGTGADVGVAEGDDRDAARTERADERALPRV